MQYFLRRSFSIRKEDEKLNIKAMKMIVQPNLFTNFLLRLKCSNYSIQTDVCHYLQNIDFKKYEKKKDFFNVSTTSDNLTKGTDIKKQRQITYERCIF